MGKSQGTRVCPGCGGTFKSLGYPNHRANCKVLNDRKKPLAPAPASWPFATKDASGVPVAGETVDAELAAWRRSLEKWRTAATNLCSHRKASGPEVSAQWACDAAMLLGVAGELLSAIDGVQLSDSDCPLGIGWQGEVCFCSAGTCAKCRATNGVRANSETSSNNVTGG